MIESKTNKLNWEIYRWRNCRRAENHASSDYFKKNKEKFGHSWKKHVDNIMGERNENWEDG